MSETECKEEVTRECEQCNTETCSIDAKDFMIGALVGGIIGAAAALLLAPKSGKELRVNINKGAKYLSEKTEGIRANAVEKGTEFAEVAKVKTSNITDKVSKQSSVIMDNVKTMKDKASKKLHENKEKVNQEEEPSSTDNEYIVKQKLQETEQAMTDSENKTNN